MPFFVSYFFPFTSLFFLTFIYLLEWSARINGVFMDFSTGGMSKSPQSEVENTRWNK